MHNAHPPSPTPRPRHCHARARCPAPCTRAHACRARSTRTLHACEPRQPCTCSHAATRAHVKAWLPCSSHWPLADRRPARRWHIWRECALQCARHLHCARGPCVTHTLCMPSTTDVATDVATVRRVTVRRDMMTMIETKTNDTMKMTKDTIDDARECAPLVPAPPMRNGAVASAPRESTSRALATARATPSCRLQDHASNHFCPSSPAQPREARL